MAIELIIEDGSGVAGANSYATLEAAEAYLAVSPYGAAWIALEDDLKAQTLIAAARRLDASVKWKGDAIAWDQARAFPRSGLAIPDDVVPRQVIEAQIELARFEALSDRDALHDSRTAPIKRQKVDVIEREFFEAAPAPLVPEHVQRLVATFAVATADGSSAGRGATGQALRLSRG